MNLLSIDILMEIPPEFNYTEEEYKRFIMTRLDLDEEDLEVEIV